MPRPCSICQHPQRPAIDAALVGGDTFRVVANRFAASESAVQRHQANHVPAHLAEAKHAEVVAQADVLLEDIQTFKLRALGLLDKAEAGVETVLRGRGGDQVVLLPDLKAAVGALREARGCIELLAKVEGRLKGDAPQVQVAVLTGSSEWAALRGAVLTALAPYAEARAAVLAALSGPDASLGVAPECNGVSPSRGAA